MGLFLVHMISINGFLSRNNQMLSEYTLQKRQLECTIELLKKRLAILEEPRMETHMCAADDVDSLLALVELEERRAMMKKTTHNRSVSATRRRRRSLTESGSSSRFSGSGSAIAGRRDRSVSVALDSAPPDIDSAKWIEKDPPQQKPLLKTMSSNPALPREYKPKLTKSPTSVDIKAENSNCKQS